MLVTVPMSLREANDFIVSFHRHNGRTARNGGSERATWVVGCQRWGCQAGGGVILEDQAVRGHPGNDDWDGSLPNSPGAPWRKADARERFQEPLGIQLQSPVTPGDWAGHPLSC